MTPQLTIAVTTYNYGRFLPTCLDSILGQDFTDFEVVVLDNGSTDDTRQVMQAYLHDPRVTYVRHAVNMSAMYNWNAAIRCGSGRYFTLVAADDFLLPGHLRHMIGLLTANPQCVMAYTPVQHVDGDGNAVNSTPHVGYAKSAYIGGDDHIGLLAYGNYTCTSACVIDREQVHADLFFELDALGAGDLEFDIRLAGKYRNFAYDPVAGVCYRQHAAQHSRSDFYKTAEPLYGHLFLLEQNLDKLTTAQIERYRANFAEQIAQFVHAFDHWNLHPDERARAQNMLYRLSPDYDPQRDARIAGRISVLLPYSVFAQDGDAIFAMLEAQTYQDWECIVVYDGDAAQLQRLSDAVQPLAAPWKIQLLVSDAIDLAESLNAAAQHAGGAYLLALHAGLRLLPGQLEQAVAVLRQQPATDIAAFVHPDDLAFFASEEPDGEALLTHSPIAGCALLRHKVWVTASRYNPSFDGADVLWDFWVHALRRGARVAAMADPQTARAADAPPSTPLAMALLVYANARCVTTERLGDAILFLREHAALWLAPNQRLLDRHRGYTTAAGLAYLARCLDVAPPGKTASHVAAPTGDNYIRWILARRLPAAQGARFIEAAGQWQQRVRIIPVVLDLHNDGAMLQRSLRGLETQVYAPEKIIVLSSAHRSGGEADPRVQWLVLEEAWADTLNRLLPQVEGDWFYLLHAGDSLEPDTLLLLADTVHHYPDLACAYADEDAMDANGGVAEPVLKPALNLDLLRSMPYVGRSMAVSRAAFVALGGFSGNMGDIAPVDFLFRVIENLGFGAVAQLNQVLCHSGLPFAAWRAREDVVAHMRQATAAHLSRLGLSADITPQDHALQRITYQFETRPSVSILISAEGMLADLQRAVQNVLEKTAYANFELLIAGADESCRDAARINQWLQQAAAADPRLRLHLGQAPAAANNKAAMLNQLAQQAGGEYLLVLSHAAAVLQTEWLDLLLNHAQRQEIGVVGARTINRHKHVQNGGMVAGLNGPAGAAFAGENLDSAAYLARAQADQNYAMVGGDCMMMRKTVFDSVGGFDAQYRRFALAAADLCLRIRDTGYLGVWTPHAVLLLEDNAPVSGLQLVGVDTENNAFYRKWWSVIGNDPAYNVNLSLHGKGFEVEGRTELIGSSVASLQLSKILIWTDIAAEKAKAAPELAPYFALADAALAEVTVMQQLPAVPDLARMGLDSVVLLGALNAERMRSMQLLRAATPLYLIHAPLAAPTRIEAGLMRAQPDFADRVVVSDAAMANAYSEFHASVMAPGAYAPGGEIDLAATAAKTAAKTDAPAVLRVGLDGDLDNAAQAFIAQVWEQIGDAAALVVHGRRYPLALRAHIAEYHQKSAFAPASAAGAPCDLALAPAAEANTARLLQIMKYGAAGIPVIAMAVAEDAPLLQGLARDVAQWVAAIRAYILQPALLGEDGVKLQQAVRERSLLSNDRLVRWRDALCA
jgi:glycosyltransferase involved in cell wall biosynthesis